jgi:hypothetical protein
MTLKAGPRGAGWWACAALVLAGCGGRDADVTAPISSGDPALGLERAVVLPDDALSRVVVLTSAAPDQLLRTALPVGQNIVSLRPDVTGHGVLVLSGGVQPRRNADDELPSLTLIDTRDEPVVTARYELTEPFANVTLDPEGRWAVLSGAAENFVTNPNQLVLIDLTDPEFEPITKTIRSFGAAPDRFRFTETLDVPGGARRFLIVETRQDVTLVDLEDLARPEITIGLPPTPAGASGRSQQVAVHPGIESIPEDARLAIRLENDPSLVLVSFTPSEDGRRDFTLTPNLVDVGSPPAELEFVTTDGGLRLAVLVPGRSEATLIEPLTTTIERVTLPDRFNRLRRVTEGAALGADGDVALLWSPESSMVAFWSLGRTSARAFRSVDVLQLDARVTDVLDVPGDDFGHKKLLSAQQSRFFVLDLERRQSFPMLSSNNLSLTVAPDGRRAWAFAPGSNRFAQIDLSTLLPTNLQIDHPIQRVFDVAGSDGQRTLIALHNGGSHGVTLMNALDPDTAQTRYYPGLLLEGLQ